MFDQPYHKLQVWRKADEFVVAVYKATRAFPDDEKFGLTSQLRRAASSVPTNIVEGQAKNSNKDFVRFMTISRGSVAECAYHLELAYKLGYLSAEKYRILEELRRETSYLLHKTIEGVRAK